MLRKLTCTLDVRESLYAFDRHPATCDGRVLTVKFVALSNSTSSMTSASLVNGPTHTASLPSIIICPSTTETSPTDDHPYRLGSPIKETQASRGFPKRRLRMLPGRGSGMPSSWILNTGSSIQTKVAKNALKIRRSISCPMAGGEMIVSPESPPDNHFPISESINSC